MQTRIVLGLILSTGFLLSACTSALGPSTPSQQEQTSVEFTGTATPVIPKTTPEQPSLPALLPAESPPRGAASEFSTDFSKHTISYSEILSGGPPKDGIPAIDEPLFVGINDANGWLKPVEPVILVEVGDEARAYPLQILIWHEIVNDTIGDLPLAVTFCPLCNTPLPLSAPSMGRFWILALPAGCATVT